MSACLPLWLVKYGGAPVAMVAEVDRTSAARVANASADLDAAIGDMVVVSVGTGRPGARGLVTDLRGGPGSASWSAAAAEATPTVREEANIYTRKRSLQRATPRAVRAYKAACAAVGMSMDEATKAQNDRACAVRFGVWIALSDAGMTFTAVAAVTGHIRSTIAKKVNLIRDAARRGEPDPNPVFTAAREAAALSMQGSRDGA